MKIKNQSLKVKCHLFMVTLILVSSLSANAWKTYTNSNFVNDIVADAENLYCATLGGLAIFSRSKNVFSRVYTNVDGLLSNRLKCLLFDRNELLWIGTNSGIVLYDKVTQSFNQYPSLGSPDQNDINCMAIAGDTILVGTQNGLVIINTKGTAIFNDDVILSQMMPTQISCKVFAIGVHNEFWISACPGLVKLERNLQNYALILHPFGDSVKAMTVINDTLYIASEQGIARYNGISFQGIVNFPQRYSVFDITYYDNKFYIATTNGLLQYDFSNLGFIFNTDTRAITIADSLWIGVGGLTWFGGGLNHRRNNEWYTYKTNGLSSNIVSSVTTDQDGVIYATHYPVSYKTISRKSIDDYWEPLCDTIANSYVAFIDNNNCIWFGHWVLNGGLSCYQPAYQTWQAKTWIGLKGVVGAFGIDKNQVKWVHNQNNTIIAMDSVGQLVIPEFIIPGLSRPERHGYEINFDSQNRVWLGSSTGLVMIDYNNTLYDISDDNYRIFNAGLQEPKEINSITIDVNKQIWCATDQGAAVLQRDSFRLYNTTNSPQLLSNKILRIKADMWGGVWMLCPLGLSYYNIYTKQWDSYTANNSKIIPNYDNDDKFYQWLDIDESRGKILIATKEGISQYCFRVAPVPILSAVKIYPNPYIKSQHNVITFDSLPLNARVKIYSLDGTLIQDLAVNPNYAAVRWLPRWLASGIYIAVITSGEKYQIMKFAVVN